VRSPIIDRGNYYSIIHICFPLYRNIFCGRLQCDGSATSLKYRTYFHAKGTGRVNGLTCNGVVFDVDDDPGMIPSGTSCDPGKVCI